MVWMSLTNLKNTHKACVANVGNLAITAELSMSSTLSTSKVAKVVWDESLSSYTAFLVCVEKNWLKQKRSRMQVPNTTSSDELPQSNHVFRHPSFVPLLCNLHGKCLHQLRLYYWDTIRVKKRVNRAHYIIIIMNNNNSNNKQGQNSFSPSYVFYLPRDSSIGKQQARTMRRRRYDAVFQMLSTQIQLHLTLRLTKCASLGRIFFFTKNLKSFWLYPRPIPLFLSFIQSLFSLDHA